MMRDNQTPVAIHKRNWKFGRGHTARRWWHGDDAGRTAFFNALSSTFPSGEKFFMDAVRHYRDRVPADLQKQIDDFVYQEAMHSREHVFFNRQARDAGYDMAAAEDRAARVLALAIRQPAIVQLAATCALEHFTATLAHAALADARHLQGADDESLRMWSWHAMEEIEHKAVAYDTFLHVTRGIAKPKRWFLRVAVMVGASLRFHYVIFRNTAGLLAQDQQNTLNRWLKLLGFLYVRPGMMRRLFVGMFGYFRPGFHPWQHDDSALLFETQSRLDLYTAAKVAV